MFSLYLSCGKRVRHNIRALQGWPYADRAKKYQQNGVRERSQNSQQHT
jgi:hypothetical protein